MTARSFSQPQVTHIKTIHQEDELIEIQSDTGTWYQRWGVRASNLGGQVIRDCMVERETEREGSGEEWRGRQGLSLCVG